MGPGRPPNRIFTPEEEEDIFDKLENGGLILPIAEELGMSRASFRRWCDNPARSARVKEARQAAARNYFDDAEHELRAAHEPFALAKARELAHHLRRKAAMANPREFGEKIDHAISGTLNIEQIKRVVIDSASPVSEAGASD